MNISLADCDNTGNIISPKMYGRRYAIKFLEFHRINMLSILLIYFCYIYPHHPFYYCFVVEDYILSHFLSPYIWVLSEIGDVDIRVSANIFIISNSWQADNYTGGTNSQFAVVWKWTYPPLKMPSHYTTSGLSSLVGREGIENLVFGPGSVRSQNIHFTFSGAVGRKDAANMPGTGSMDGS